jgi:hypothetical protein
MTYFLPTICIRLAFCFFFICTPFAYLYAQGFNWQYSARMPSESPTLFAGVQGGFALTQHFSSVQMQERMADGRVCDCHATFERAGGQEFRAGVLVEQWLLVGNVALYGAAYMQHEQATFQALAAPLRVSPWTSSEAAARGDFQTEYIFATTTLNASVEAGVKYKAYPLPLFASAGVSLAYMVRDGSLLDERSVNVNYNYEQNALPLDFVRRAVLVPSVRAAFGVDLPLARGLYASPSLFAAIPMTSLATNAAWFRLSYGVQIAVLYGLNR